VATDSTHAQQFCLFMRNFLGFILNLFFLKQTRRKAQVKSKRRRAQVKSKRFEQVKSKRFAQVKSKTIAKPITHFLLFTFYSLLFTSYSLLKSSSI
jgi:hypothetical protein